MHLFLGFLFLVASLLNQQRGWVQFALFWAQFSRMKPFKHLLRGRVKWGKNRKKPTCVACIWCKRLLNYHLLTYSHLEYFYHFYSIKSKYLVSPFYICYHLCLLMNVQKPENGSCFPSQKGHVDKWAACSVGMFNLAFLCLPPELLLPGFSFHSTHDCPLLSLS